MVPVVIALGSNVGDAVQNLQSAVDQLREFVHELTPSRIYQTAPMYVTDQPPFLNAAVSGQTDLGPLALLAQIKAIEQRIGRQTRERYGPREIDLDIIAYGALHYRQDDRLELPHPRAGERRFVLLPVSEIAPGLKLTKINTVEDLLFATESQAGDVLLKNNALLSVHRHQ